MMPIASTSSTESGHEALETILDHFDSVNSTGNGPVDMDVLFMKEVMRGTLLQNLVKAHDTLEDEKELKPCEIDSVGRCKDLLADLTPVVGSDELSAELAGILKDLNFTFLLETHDQVASGNFGHPTVDSLQPNHVQDQGGNAGYDSIKLIGVRKVGDQPLDPPVSLKPSSTLCPPSSLSTLSTIQPSNTLDAPNSLHPPDTLLSPKTLHPPSTIRTPTVLYPPSIIHLSNTQNSTPTVPSPGTPHSPTSPKFPSMHFSPGSNPPFPSTSNSSPFPYPSANPPCPYSDPVVIVDMIRPGNAPLGITVRCSNGELVVARVLHGGIIDQQGLLHVGDVIKEINDVDVTNNPDAFHHHLSQSNGRVTLKIIPSFMDTLPPPSPIYLRTFFNYDPAKDTLLPCSDIGLAFDRGDILCVVDRSDPDWWQAYIVGREATSGLIPSEELEEKRRAFIPSDHLYTKKVACGLMKRKKKKKTNYETRKNYQFDRSDIISYEEVQEMPPFQRKTLILIGAQGVGRRVIVNRLIEDDPDRFGCAVASTSRPKKSGEVNGVTYNFVSRKQLEYDIVNNRLLEYGEFMGNIYATSISAVKKVCKENKICVLDVNPQTLKLIRNSQYLPFVVFVKSPNLDTLRAMHQQATGRTGVVPDCDLQKTVDESARIEQLYSHMFDFTIVNNSLEETCKDILLELENLETQRQWVPITWVYDCP